MQHGIVDDGGTWLYQEKDQSLALQLVEMGYDVWIANSRGTVYSNVHLDYTVDDREFWDFTFHEMGQYDLPANLKFVLKKTGADQVIYIGHS